MSLFSGLLLLVLLPIGAVFLIFIIGLILAILLVKMAANKQRANILWWERMINRQQKDNN